MEIRTWIDRKEQFQEKCSTEQSGRRAHRHIAITINQALRQNRLANIETAVRHLSQRPELVPGVLNQLNGFVSPSSLSFQWLPGDNAASSSLLIKNGALGLLVNTSSYHQHKGMVLTAREVLPMRLLAPEHALSYLSSQARRNKIT